MNVYSIAEALDLEVYILAALFAGSQALSDIEHDPRGLRWARTTSESSQVSRRLIGLAIMLRNQLEVSGGKPDATVGVLVPDVSSSSHHKNLSLREACNRIIHAESVDLAPDQEQQSSVPPVARTVMLGGTHNDREWRAELDALAFLNAACDQF